MLLHESHGFFSFLGANARFFTVFVTPNSITDKADEKTLVNQRVTFHLPCHPTNDLSDDRESENFAKLVKNY